MHGEEIVSNTWLMSGAWTVLLLLVGMVWRSLNSQVKGNTDDIKENQEKSLKEVGKLYSHVDEKVSEVMPRKECTLARAPINSSIEGMEGAVKSQTEATVDLKLCIVRLTEVVKTLERREKPREDQ